MNKYEKRAFSGGDPFILKHDNTFYIYCTTENDMPAFTDEHPFFETCKEGLDGIEVHTSKDLIHWENAGYCLKKGTAMGTHGFWAPEVSYYKGRFYMVYSADEKPLIAVSDSPLGPFLPHSESYLLDYPAIDGHLLFDDDENIYLYFSDVRITNRICVAKMSSDLKRIEKVYDDILIEAEDKYPWEVIDCHVAEGPFVIKHKGIYYLTYSANHTRNENYAVGYATSTSPIGPFKKYKGNPILHKFDDIIGTGHHSFMPLHDGDCDKYLCVYHCHYGKTSFKPRQICLAEAVFVPTDGDDILKIIQ